MGTLTDSTGNTNHAASDVPHANMENSAASKDDVRTCVANGKELVAEKTVITSISNNKSGKSSYQVAIFCEDCLEKA